MKGMTRRELEITDRNEIIEILDKCSYLHLPTQLAVSTISASCNP